MESIVVIALMYYILRVPRLCASFNIDETSPVIHHGPPESLFGFSVAMHREGDENMLLVGAPKAQSRFRPEIEKGGLLYRCPANNSAVRPCRVIDIDTKGHPHNKHGKAGSKSHQMFGSTVRSAGPDGPVMVCAPNLVRYLSDDEDDDEKDYSPTGVCYIATDNFNPTLTLKYNLCPHGIEQQWRCQLGFSGLMFEDAFLVGAPGSYFWQGQIFLQEYPVETGEWPMQTMRQDFTYDDSYQGYSVARGDLDSNGTDDYVTGAPLRHDMLGSVLVYSETLTFEDPFVEIVGYQTGAYFGHSVEVTDLNGDGLDDLVVGAPTYTDMSEALPLFDIGRIYIYYQDETGTLDLDPDIIQGNSTNGRFGFTLVALGDINLDGFNDLAVSAPYENGDEGVVYIFNGGLTGLSSEPSQALRPPKDGSRLFRGFGFDLSGDFDMDRNGYKDLLIGAPHSSSAVLYRSRQIIQVNLDIKFDVRGVMYKKKNLQLSDGLSVSGFNTSACLRYSGKNVSPTATFSCVLKADSFRVVSSRTYFIHEGLNIDTIQAEFHARKDQKQCFQYTTYMKRYIRDSQPIGFSFSCSLMERPQVTSNGDHIPDILDENGNSVIKQLPVFSNCSHTMCYPDLQISVERHSTNESLLIGKTSRENLFVTITNNGEEAHATSLYVRLPQGLYYSGVKRSVGHLVTCSDGDGPMTVVCELERYFEGWGNSMTLEMMLMAEGIDGATEMIDIEFFVMSSYNERDGLELDNMAMVHIPVEVQVNVVMFSASLPEKYEITDVIVKPRNFTHEEEIGPEVTHVFAVQNFGPSDIATAELTVWWPMYSYYGYLLYLLNVTLSNGEECYVRRDFNPMNLELLQREPADITLGDTTDVPVFIHDDNDSLSDEFYIDLPTNISNMKLKRTTEKLYRDRGSVADRYKNLRCKRGMEECYVIKCNLNNLLGSGRRRVVTLQLRSRIWENTFRELPDFDWTLTSTAMLEVTSVPYSVQPSFYPTVHASAKIDISKIVTAPLPSKEPPFWIILLSICGGILLLILILTIMAKIGFFTRRRFEKLSDEDGDVKT